MHHLQKMKTAYVKVKKDNSCADGYVKAQFVVKKEEATEDVVVEVKTEL